MKAKEIFNMAMVIMSVMVLGLLSIYFLKNKLDGTWSSSFYFKLTLIVSLSLFFVSYIKYIKYKKRDEWNILSFEEKCKRNAEESKEKNWFLYQKDPRDSKYSALLISDKDAVNKGGDIYRRSNVKEIKEKIAKKEITNFEKVETILKYCC